MTSSSGAGRSAIRKGDGHAALGLAGGCQQEAQPSGTSCADRTVSMAAEAAGEIVSTGLLLSGRDALRPG